MRGRATEKYRERVREKKNEAKNKCDRQKKKGGLEREETGFLDRESNINTNSLSLRPLHTCCSILTRQSQVRWQRVRQPLIGP